MQQQSAGRLVPSTGVSLTTLSYATHPNFDRISRVDLAWVQETWKIVHFWEGCRSSLSGLASAFLLGSLFGFQAQHRVWFIVFSFIILLELAPHFVRNRSVMLWMRILSYPAYPILFCVSFIPARGSEFIWIYLLAIQLLAVPMAVALWFYVGIVKKWIAASRLPLTERSAQWLRELRRQISDRTLPHVLIQRKGFGSLLTILRLGDIFIVKAGSRVDFMTSENIDVQPLGPEQANTASEYRISFERRGCTVRMFEKDRQALERLLAGASGV